MVEALANRATLMVCYHMRFWDVVVESDVQQCLAMLNGECEPNADIGAHAIASFVTKQGGSHVWDHVGTEWLFDILAEDTNRKPFRHLIVSYKINEHDRCISISKYISSERSLCKSEKFPESTTCFMLTTTKSEKDDQKKTTVERKKNRISKQSGKITCGVFGLWASISSYNGGIQGLRGMCFFLIALESLAIIGGVIRDSLVSRAHQVLTYRKNKLLLHPSIRRKLDVFCKEFLRNFLVPMDEILLKGRYDEEVADDSMAFHIQECCFYLQPSSSFAC
ncbi:unnamed protein product [Prunus brigantina]